MKLIFVMVNNSCQIFQRAKGEETAQIAGMHNNKFNFQDLINFKDIL